MTPARSSTAVLVRYALCATTGRLAMAGSTIALVLLALERAGPSTVGLLTGAAALPQIIAGPLVGVLPQRARSPARVYVSAFLVFGTALVAIDLLLGRAPLYIPILIALLLGCAAPIVMGGMTAVLSLIVAPHQRARALALDSSTYNMAGILGPLAAAAIAATVSNSAAVLAMAACSAVAAALFALVPRPAPPSPDAAVGPTRIRDGLTIIITNPQLRGSTLATTLSSFGRDSILPLTVALLALDTGRAASAGATLLAANAIGALIGSIVITVRPIPEARANTVLYGSLMWTAVVLGACAAIDDFVLLATLFFIAGTANGPLLASTMIIRTIYTPEALRSQVFTTAVGLRGSSALGAGIGGAVAGDIGAHGLIFAIAVCQLVCVPVGLLASRPRKALTQPAGVPTLLCANAVLDPP